MRQIVVLDATLVGGNYQVTAAYWLVAPATRVVPLPNFISLVPMASARAPNGTTSTELETLRSGTIVEQVRMISLTASGQTTANVQSALATNYGVLQSALNAQVFAGSHLVGSYWDGATWTAGP